MEEHDIIIGIKELTTMLYIEEESLNKDNIKDVIEMLDRVPEMYKKSRDIILKETENGTIDFFVEWHIDELDLAELFGVKNNKEITREMFLNFLEPRTINLYADEDGDIISFFDFSLPEDYSDELLVIRFNNKYEVFDISHES